MPRQEKGAARARSPTEVSDDWRDQVPQVRNRRSRSMSHRWSARPPDPRSDATGEPRLHPRRGRPRNTEESYDYRDKVESGSHPAGCKQIDGTTRLRSRRISRELVPLLMPRLVERQRAAPHHPKAQHQRQRRLGSGAKLSEVELQIDCNRPERFGGCQGSDGGRRRSLRGAF